MSGYEHEFYLAKKLQAMCKESGKEKDPALTAKLIYKLAKLYRNRSPEQLNLIKSVGLLNAAIARNPSSASAIRKDLNEICNHILNLAKAINRSADLMKKAKEIKIWFRLLRKEVSQNLNSPVTRSLPGGTGIGGMEESEKSIKEQNKIAAMLHINKTIAEKYTMIMSDLSQFCLEVMGTAPCKFAVVGMGSLAREEITPYSDFEHIIVLEDGDHLESCITYFRWYTVIFHTVVLNLQETIIPALNIATLNNPESSLGDWFYDVFTRRGVSFDGMMPHACKFPLGRQQHTNAKPWQTELIKPIKEMLEYLDAETSLKNGYHLSDILTKTCFVFGNKTVFEEFANGVQQYINKKTRSENIEEIKQQVKDDLSKFSARSCLVSLTNFDSINIKQLVYRISTLFVAALGRIHNISANSNFDTVNEMARKHIITHLTKHKLLYALALACEMRLRVYTEFQSQRDTAIVLNHHEDDIDRFLSIVGTTATINYFQIAYCLQCEVAKHLNLTAAYFYSDPHLVNVTIRFAFGIFDLKTDLLLDSSKTTWDLKKFDFDSYITQLELHTQPRLSDVCLTKMKTQLAIQKQFGVRRFKEETTNPCTSIKADNLNVSQLESVAEYLYTKNIYDEALEFFKHIIFVYSYKSTKLCQKRELGLICYKAGHCLIMLRRYSEAKEYIAKSVKLLTLIPLSKKKNGNIAMALNLLGVCQAALRQYEDSLSTLSNSLFVYQNITVDAEQDVYIAIVQNNMGCIYLNMTQTESSINCFKEALKINQESTSKEQKIAVIFNNFAISLNKLKLWGASTNYFRQAVNIYQNLTCNEDDYVAFALILNNFGVHLLELQLYEESILYLTHSLELYQRTSLDLETKADIAIVLMNITKCQKYLGRTINFEAQIDHFHNLRLNEFLSRTNIEGSRFCTISLLTSSKKLQYLKS